MKKAFEKMSEAFKEFSLLSLESVKLIWAFMVCFGFLFVLASSIRDLKKELNFPF